MNESTIPLTKHFTSCASLAAIGVKLQALDLFGPIRKRVHIAQKAVKHTPLDKLYDGFISLLAGAHGLVEINSRLRADPALQAAFGRQRCAEQSVVQETLDACTAENVTQLEQAIDEIYQRQSQGFQHNYQADLQVLDVDMSGLPCGPKAAFATKGYFAKQRNRRGRQLGRVLASRYDEVVIDRLFAGNTQLTASLQPLVVAAETTLDLNESKRSRTIVRVDSGGGSLDDINWLLARGYLVHAKDYSGQRARQLAQTVTSWIDDPRWPERQVGWVTEPATAYVRPVVRIAVRCRQQNGQWAIGVLISAIEAKDILRLTGHAASLVTDPVAVLLAYVTFYDQRGGGIETSLKGDKQGLGMTRRTKKRFEAQQMLMLLGSLAHNVIVWARGWLRASTDKLHHYGILRMVRDVFHISGFLLFDRSSLLVQIVLNQDASLAHALLHSFRELCAPMHLVISLDKT
jgi:hypothetical protein